MPQEKQRSDNIRSLFLYECYFGAEGKWYYYEAPFAVATWKWTENGFKVMGVET